MIRWRARDRFVCCSRFAAALRAGPIRYASARAGCRSATCCSPFPRRTSPPHGTWEVKFTHRFNQSLAEGSFSDQLHSLFGLDTNADVSFGVSYAMRPRPAVLARAQQHQRHGRRRRRSTSCCSRRRRCR